jgi:hypothetical protein
MYEVLIRVDSLEDAKALMSLIIRSPHYDAVQRLHLTQLAPPRQDSTAA